MATFKQLVDRDATREQLEDWTRSHARAVPISTDLVLCRVLGKHLMYCLSRDSALTPHLAMDGIWEPWITMAVARHLKPGMRCLDVGACYGYYALLMADIVGETGAVEAWEPYHADMLQHNANLNGLPVAVVPMAIGDGQPVIMRPPPSDGLRLFNAGGVEVVRGAADVVHNYERKVQSAQPMGLFDFIKIDVEGFEAQAWDAMRFERYTDPVTVCMEFTPEKHLKPKAFLERVQSEGFQLGSVGHDGMPRPCSLEEALTPDTGPFRMLWLTRR